MRKRLSDITNLHSQHKSLFKNQENVLPSKVVVDDSSTKTYIQQLAKENAVLMKLIEEKDKIIEFNGVELQKLRVTLQKTQLQNWQLAQSNSQMLAELNIAKDRLKTLQHELVCKDGLFKAKSLELQEKGKMDCETNSIQEEDIKPKEVAVNEPLEDSNDDDNNKNDNINNANKVCFYNESSKPKRGRATKSQSMGPTTSQKDKEVVDNNNDNYNSSSSNNNNNNNNNKKENKVSKQKRECPTRSQSMGPTTSQKSVDKEVVENKRRCLRRQSARLKPPGKQEDMFELDVADNPVHQSMDISQSKPDSDVAGDGESLSESSKNTEPQRSSSGSRQHKAVHQTMDTSHSKSDSAISGDGVCLSESSKNTGAVRISIGRPQRKATEKVQSYKDPPLNIKMRRPEPASI